MGRITLDNDEPRSEGGDEEVRVSATVHGGAGSIRQGIIRQLVVRFELSDGLHIYGEPVPEGMIPHPSQRFRSSRAHHRRPRLPTD